MSVDLSSVFPPAPDDLGNLQAHPDLVAYQRGEFTPSKAQADKIAALELAAAWADLRARRNQLLSASDWTQLRDTMGADNGWAAYRQALRDLPEGTVDPASPVWPVAPS